MPQLPTDADLGFVTPQVSRPIASVDTSGLTQGVQQFGQGLSQAGQGLTAYANAQKARQDDLNRKMADGDAAEMRADLLMKQQDSPDPDTYKTQSLTGHQAIAAKYFTDPAQQQAWLAGQKASIASGAMSVKGWADNQDTQQQTADWMKSSLDKRDAYFKAPDEASRTAIINSVAAGIQNVVDNTNLSPVAAQNMLVNWREGLARTGVNRIPAAQRLAVLSQYDEGSAKEAFTYFRGQGWSPAQASAIVGGMLTESGLDSKAVKPGDGTDGSDSIGQGQWNGPRAQALKAFAASQGKDWTDRPTQWAFLQSELTGSESKAGDLLRQAQTPGEAASAFLQYERPQGYQAGLQGAANGANRLGYTQSVYSKFSGDQNAGAVPYAHLAAFLSPGERDDMRQAAARDWTTDQRASAAAQGAERATVQQLMQDDHDSIVATGQPVSALTPDRVTAALGPQATQQFLQRRQAAQDYFTATRDWGVIPQSEIEQRVEAMRPQGGASDFADRQQMYQSARDAADKIAKQRAGDPAGAVSTLPAVRQASASFDANHPETFGAVVKARKIAQTAIGIPPDLQSPITDDEAQRYASMLQPVSRGQAEAGQQEAIINGVVNQVRQRYGADSQAAMTRILSHVTMKTDAADVLATAMENLTKPSTGPVVAPADARRVQIERDAQRAAAVASTPQPSGVAFDPVSGASMIAPDKPMKPFSAASDLLRSDPRRLMAPFVQKFGPDAVPADLVPLMPPDLAAKRRYGAVMPSQQ